MICLFVAMTGFMASAIRAGLMALVVIIAELGYQRYSPLRALIFVSILMVLYNPLYLLYDSSFHLSFLATYGVIAISPLLERYLTFVPHGVLRTTVSTTFGAYIMTAPYLMYFFQGLSIVSIIANVIILPGIPVLMLVSSVALGVSMASPLFAHIIVRVAEYISQTILAIVHTFSRVPFGYIPTSISIWVCVGLYGLIFVSFITLKKKVDLLD
jgi:competence protein ComEC